MLGPYGRPAMGEIINTRYACAPLIDGRAGAQASQRGPNRRPSYLSQAGCVIVSGFRAALDLDTYPISNFICPRCAERAKPGRGKPVLIMQLFRLFSRHISRTQSFQPNRHISFLAFVALKLLVSLISRLVA